MLAHHLDTPSDSEATSWPTLDPTPNMAAGVTRGNTDLPHVGFICHDGRADEQELQSLQQVLRPPCGAAVVVLWITVLLCYVDEAGNEQALGPPDAPPVLVLTGLVIAQSRAHSLTREFLKLKNKFASHVLNSSSRLSDAIRHEIKGSDLRADLRVGNRNRVRRAYGILDKLLELLEQQHVTIVGFVDVKQDGGTQHPNIYEQAIAYLAEQFEAQLRVADTSGIMILDARTKVKNVPSVNTITTRKFKSGGDSLPHLVESPVFGHSDAHVSLQIADLVASALLFPMACSAYCQELLGNVHNHASYQGVQSRYGERLRRLEHRYLDDAGQRVGGIKVYDHKRRPATHLFKPQ